MVIVLQLVKSSLPKTFPKGLNMFPNVELMNSCRPNGLVPFILLSGVYIPHMHRYIVQLVVA